MNKRTSDLVPMRNCPRSDGVVRALCNLNKSALTVHQRDEMFPLSVCLRYVSPKKRSPKQTKAKQTGPLTTDKALPVTVTWPVAAMTSSGELSEVMERRAPRLGRLGASRQIQRVAAGRYLPLPSVRDRERVVRQSYCLEF